ncbi:NAD(P)/FAD-dependent oxidoreductase [Conexivisphaera calida]|nr:lycopene cyclase family protein [Conexivisphaera calida]
MEHDVVVVGGGPAGLAAASELSSMGYSVLLLEDDSEIGYPVKCTGIISSEGLEVFRNVCGHEVGGARLSHGEVEVRGEGKVEVNLEGLGIISIDRRLLERCLFEAAASNGARFRLSERATRLGAGSVESRSGVQPARAIVDARGASAYPRHDRLLYAMQYTCRHFGGDRAEGHVRVVVDKAVSREYFMWQVWSESGDVLVGGAGSSPASITSGVESIIDKIACAEYRIVRSPIVIGGFAGSGSDGIFKVGDAAGAAKPLTGGGDVLGVESSLMAARAISRYLSGELSLAESHRLYENTWRRAHGKEESAQKLLRAVYERMDARDVWGLLERMHASGMLDNPRAKFDELGGWVIASLGARVIGAMVLRRIQDALALHVT